MIPPRYSIDSSVSSLVTGLFLVKGDAVTLEPGTNVRVPPVWPLACAHRVDHPFGSLDLALKCEYIIQLQEMNVSIGGTILRVDTFWSNVEFLPITIPTK